MDNEFLIAGITVEGTVKQQQTANTAPNEQTEAAVRSKGHSGS